jgi:hypothetical protein
VQPSQAGGQLKIRGVTSGHAGLLSRRLRSLLWVLLAPALVMGGLVGLTAFAEPASAAGYLSDASTSTTAAELHHPNHHVVGWIVGIIAIVIVLGIFAAVRFRKTNT